MFKLNEEKKIIFIYLILGFSWIYFSDNMVFFLASDIEKANQIQLYKGIFYVIFTAFVLYVLLKKYITNLRDQKDELNSLNEQLTAYNEELLAMNEELDQSFDELNEMNKKFVSMINVVSRLNDSSIMSEDKFLSVLLNNAVQIAPEADYGKIYVLEDDKCRFVDTVGHDIETLKEIRLDRENIFNFDSTGVSASHNYSIKLDKIPEKIRDKFLSALKDIKDSLYINIVVNDHIAGRIVLDIAADSKKEFSDTTQKILESFATLASSFFAFRRYDNLKEEFTRELISSIVKILEIYDIYTKGHSENVAELSEKIARKMNISDKGIRDTYWSGMVHDIGKLLIPLDILNKKDQLTENEYNLIKNHPVWGNQALSDSESLKHIARYVLYHHERWDGRGYPAGLQKDEIPIISQILSVADSWDAMRSKRAYREPLSREDALQEIKTNRGKQFSPEVVDAFLEVLEEKDF
ncbi:MAG: HD-GYP domain-containing protein [Bacillota bacterium]